ncbi:MAG: protein translocase subunit SecF, partial [Planctomycetota bacterium]|nr:protein translocase subunit SecF [Planctomycetota bacterium]
VFSVLVIAVGLGAVAVRRSSIFDIDFLGGTSVTMLLDKTAGEKYDDSVEVRKIVKGLLDKVTVDGANVTHSLSKVEIEGATDNVAWKLDTSIPSEALKKTAEDGTELKRFAEADRPATKGDVIAGVEFLKQQLQQAAEFGGGENAQSAFVHYEVTVDENTFQEVEPATSAVVPQAPAAGAATAEPATAEPATAEPATAEPATPDDQTPANPAPAEPAAAGETDKQTPASGDGARREKPQQRIASLRRQGFVVAPAVAQDETPAADESAPPADTSATDTPTETPPAGATDAAQPVAGQVSPAAGVVPAASVDTTVGILEFQEKYPINGITLKQELSSAAALVDIPLAVFDGELLDEGNIHVAKAADDGSRGVDPEWRTNDSGPQTRWQITLVGLPREQALTVVRQLKKSFSEEPIWLSSSTIGGRVAGDMQATAVAALIASLMGIIGYLWIRFQRVIYGLAAVVALLHDVLITLGAIALSAYVADYLGWLMIEEFKISLPMVAAFLTIVGYSLNDTIVVFDRIREVRGKSPSITDVMINKSINQTLGRTLLTSLTTLIVVVILYALGGAGIHGFAFALVVGVMVGTYSSIFVASPALLWMARRAVARGDTV